VCVDASTLPPNCKPLDVSAAARDRYFLTASCSIPRISRLWMRSLGMQRLIAPDVIGRILAVMLGATSYRQGDTDAQVTGALHCAEVLETLCLAPAARNIVVDIKLPDFVARDRLGCGSGVGVAWVMRC
jgi:hypothetical protein